MNLTGTYSDSIAFSEDKAFSVLVPQANRPLLDAEVREISESSLTNVRRLAKSLGADVFVPDQKGGTPFTVTYSSAQNNLTLSGATSLNAGSYSENPAILYAHGFPIAIHTPEISYANQVDLEPARGANPLDVSIFPAGSVTPVRPAEPSGKTYDIAYLSLKFQEVSAPDYTTAGTEPHSTAVGAWVDSSIRDSQIGVQTSNRLKAVVTLRTHRVTASELLSVSDPFLLPFFSTPHDGGNLSASAIEKEYHVPLALLVRDNSVNFTVVDLLTVFGKRAKTVNEISYALESGAKTTDVTVRDIFHKAFQQDPSYLNQLVLNPTGVVSFGATALKDLINKDRAAFIGMDLNESEMFGSEVDLIDSEGRGITSDALNTGSVTPRAVNPYSVYSLSGTVYPETKNETTGYDHNNTSNEVGAPSAWSAYSPISDFVTDGYNVFPNAHFYKLAYLGSLTASPSDIPKSYLNLPLSPTPLSTHIELASYNANLNGWLGLNTDKVSRISLGLRTDSAAWVSELHSGSSRSLYGFAGRHSVGTDLLVGISSQTPSTKVASIHTDTDFSGNAKVIRFSPVNLMDGSSERGVGYGEAQGWLPGGDLDGYLSSTRSATEFDVPLNAELRAGTFRARGFSQVGGTNYVWDTRISGSWLTSDSREDYAHQSSTLLPLYGSSPAVLNSVFGSGVALGANWSLSTLGYLAHTTDYAWSKAFLVNFGSSGTSLNDRSAIATGKVRSLVGFASDYYRSPAFVIEEDVKRLTPFYFDGDYTSDNPVNHKPGYGLLRLTSTDTNETTLGGIITAQTAFSDVTISEEDKWAYFAQTSNTGATARDAIARSFAAKRFVASPTESGFGVEVLSSVSGVLYRTGVQSFGLSVYKNFGGTDSRLMAQIRSAADVGSLSLSTYTNNGTTGLIDSNVVTGTSRGWRKFATADYMLKEVAFSAERRASGQYATSENVVARYFDGYSDSDPQATSSVLIGAFDTVGAEKTSLSTFVYTGPSIQNITSKLHVSSLSVTAFSDDANDFGGVVFTDGLQNPAGRLQVLTSAGVRAKFAFNLNSNTFRALKRVVSGTGVYSWVLAGIDGSQIYAEDGLKLNNAVKFGWTSSELISGGITPLLSGTNFTKAVYAYNPESSEAGLTWLNYGASVRVSHRYLAAETLSTLTYVGNDTTVGGLYSSNLASGKGLSFFEEGDSEDKSAFYKESALVTRVVSKNGLTSFVSDKTHEKVSEGFVADAVGGKWNPSSIEAFELLSGGLVLGADFGGLTRNDKVNRNRFGSDNKAVLALSHLPLDGSTANSDALGSVRFTAARITEANKAEFLRYGLHSYTVDSHGSSTGYKSVLRVKDSVLVDAANIQAQKLSVSKDLWFYDHSTLGDLTTTGSATLVPALSTSSNFARLSRYTSTSSDDPSFWNSVIPFDRTADSSSGDIKGAFVLYSSGEGSTRKLATLRLGTVVADSVRQETSAAPYGIVHKLAFGTLVQDGLVYENLRNTFAERSATTTPTPSEVTTDNIRTSIVPVMYYDNSAINAPVWDMFAAGDDNGGGFILESGYRRFNTEGLPLGPSKKASLWAYSAIFDENVSASIFSTAFNRTNYTAPIMSSYGLKFGADITDVWKDIRLVSNAAGAQYNLMIPGIKHNVKLGGVVNGVSIAPDSALEIWGSALEEVDFNPNANSYTPYVYDSYATLQYSDYSNGTVRETNPLVFDRKKINLMGSVYANSLVKSPVVKTSRLELSHGSILTTEGFTQDTSDGKNTLATVTGVNLFNSGFLSKEVSVVLIPGTDSIYVAPEEILGFSKLQGSYMFNISVLLVPGTVMDGEFTESDLAVFSYDVKRYSGSTLGATVTDSVNYSNTVAKEALAFWQGVLTVDRTSKKGAVWESYSSTNSASSDITYMSSSTGNTLYDNNPTSSSTFKNLWYQTTGGGVIGFTGDSLLGAGKILRSNIKLASGLGYDHGVVLETCPAYKNDQIVLGFKLFAGAISGSPGVGPGVIQPKTVASGEVAFKAIVNLSVIPVAVPFHTEWGTNNAAMTSFLPSPVAVTLS